MNILFSKIIFLIVTSILLSNCATNQTKDKSDKHLKQVFAEEKKYDGTVFEQAFKKLNSGDTLSNSEIQKFSQNLETRADFYDLLVKFNKESLFPQEYYSFEKAAESVMTNWLLYPTELDTIPSKIEVIKKVDFIENDTTFIYYVLKFKTEEPHWSAKNGWMLGVVGPYFKNSKPYDWVNGTFSRLSKVQEITTEKEVEWTHKNIFRKTSE